MTLSHNLLAVLFAVGCSDIDAFRHALSVDDLVMMNEPPWGQAFQVPRGRNGGEGNGKLLIVFGQNKVWVTNDCVDLETGMIRITKEGGYAGDCIDSGNMGSSNGDYSHNLEADGKMCEQNRIYLHSTLAVNGSGITTIRGSHKVLNPMEGGQINQCSETDANFLTYASSATDKTPPEAQEGGKGVMKEMYYEFTFNKQFSEVTSFDVGFLKDGVKQSFNPPATMVMTPVTCSSCGYCFPEDMSIDVCN